MPTPARVAAFANETSAVQLSVLNRLRHRSSDAIAVYLAAVAVGITFFIGGGAALVESVPVLRTSKHYLRLFDMNVEDTAKLMFNIQLAGLIVAFTLIAILGLLLALRIRSARVLLAAYEGELERRFAARGLRARRWQREHSPDWDAS